MSGELVANLLHTEGLLFVLAGSNIRLVNGMQSNMIEPCGAISVPGIQSCNYLILFYVCFPYLWPNADTVAVKVERMPAHGTAMTWKRSKDVHIISGACEC